MTLVFVLLMLCVFFLLLVLAVRLDRRDAVRSAPIEVVDNSEKHAQRYVIEIETGMRRNAGTTAKVCLVLCGEDGTSETRELVRHKHSDASQQHHDDVIFERNSRVTFLVTQPETLGAISRLQVWHDNAGGSPGWFLSRVTVKDINTGVLL